MFLGSNANGKRVILSPKLRQQTHTHVIGGSGTGKSKFLEWMIRQDIRDGRGLCVLDWHGTLYNDVLRSCAWHGVGRRGHRSLILLNPSNPDFVTGFNPFVAGEGDVSVQVSRRVDATIRPWGVTNTDQTPTFSRICRLLFTFMIEKRETLPNAAHLLHFKNKDLRTLAASSLKDSFARAEWEEMLSITKFQDWKSEVLSTKNRLMRFVGSQSVRRFMGLENNNVDLEQVMDQGKILLVNLGSSDFLDREAARVFASLLLNEFFETAMRRATKAPAGKKPRPFSLYLDEFQEYITDDVAAMLDQVRKGGLQMVLAHQHLGHFQDNERLKESVFTNARIRAVFGGLSYPSACFLADEMFLPDLNSRQIKKAYYHTIHLYREETRTISSHSTTHSSSHSSGISSGRGSATSTGTVLGSSSSFSAPGEMAVFMPPPTEGWFTDGESESGIASDSSSTFEGVSEVDTEGESESFGETVVPVWVPIPKQELTTETEWNREEKLSKIAEMLKCQQQAHCFIKLDTAKTQPLKVSFVRDFHLPPQLLAKYQRDVYAKQGAIPALEADRLIAEREEAFLLNLGEVIDQEAVELKESDEDEFAGPSRVSMDI